MNRTIQAHDLSGTRAVAAELAATLGPDDVVALLGPLGAGKTAFVQAVAQTLGVTDPVTSPTFVRLNVYEGSLTVYHLDLYRVNNPSAFTALGLDEWLDSGGIALIEWADRAAGVLPPRTTTVRLDFAGHADARTITIQEGPPAR